MKRLGVVLVTAVAIVATTTSLAAAGSWSGKDPRRDVTGLRYDPEPEPCGTTTEVNASGDANTDIISLAVRHMKYSVEAVVGFSALDRRSTQKVETAIKTNERTYTVEVNRFQDGRPSEVLLFQYERPQQSGTCGSSATFLLGPLRCRNLSGAYALGSESVAVSIPRRCLSHPRWVRGAARTHRWEDDVVHSDTWAPAGSHVPRFIGPFGARVHRL